ncbi:MAG TPA: hypothetical protein VN026_12455 [Bacteroidia bacterium]|jgi:hypothetical protein|nr:hypothetical protein [Bacteroidia bacterium]
MSKKDNTMLWLILLGALGGALASIAKQYSETKETGEDFGWDKIDWGRTGKGALTGSIVGLAVGVVVKLIGWDEEEEFYPSHHLNRVLSQNSLRNNPETLEVAIQKRNDIKEFFVEHFGGQLAGSPLNWGSYAQGTANGSNFDLDVIIPFSKTIGTIEEMYEATHRTLAHRYKDDDLISFRKQKKSIGVKFRINGEDIFIDVVPGREINSYEMDRELKLYCAPTSQGGKPTSIKTNTTTHKVEISGLTDEKKLTRLMKLWRDKYGFNFKSIAIRNMVINAFDTNSHSIPYDINGKLQMVMDYISKNLKTLRIVDSANSNNVISDSMSLQEKRIIAERLSYDLALIRTNQDHLKKLFPLN